MTHHAVEAALLASAARIEPAHVDDGIRRVGESLALGLTSEDFKILGKIHRDRLLPSVERAARLFVPSLLTGLLADDPGLSEHAARAIAECLIPTWWFERRHSGEQVIFYFAEILMHRIARGRFAGILRERLQEYVDQGLSDAAVEKLRSNFWTNSLRSIARSLDVDDSTIIFLILPKNMRQMVEERWRWSIPISKSADALSIGRGLVEACRKGTVRLTIGGLLES